MFINPNVAIEQGWITGIKDPQKQVQPNAIDFTLDKIFLVDSKFDALIGEARKRMRTLTEVSTWSDSTPTPTSVLSWKLEGQSVYDGTSDVYVSVPTGVAAIIYTRSTLARNGVFLVSGLYDSGYKGQIGFTIYTIGGPTFIDVGTRVGQIAFVKAESAGAYAGQYNHAQGTHYTDTAKALEQTHRVSSDQVRPQAGKKSFL